MAINDVAAERVYHVLYHSRQWFNIHWDILREFLGHNFVSGLRTLKHKKTKKNLKPKSLKTFSKKLLFFSPVSVSMNSNRFMPKQETEVMQPGIRKATVWRDIKLMNTEIWNKWTARRGARCAVTGKETTKV